MLGLGNAVTKQREWSPGSISDLIGWWDFTDVSTMFQERDGTFVTPADSDSDPIGSIKNKAKPIKGSAHEPLFRLGSYLYASSDAERPILGTHPSMGYTYGQFDGSNDHLMCERDDDGGGYQGGISGSSISDVTIDSANITYVMVIRSDNASISSSDDTILSLQTSAAYTSIYYDQGTQDFEILSNGKMTTSTQNFGSNFQTFTVISANDACTIYRNGVAEGTSTGSDWFSTGDAEGDFDTDHVGLIIGESYRAPTGGLTGKNWDGNICEILIYNKALSTEENTYLQRYLQSKYYEFD